MSAKRQTSSGIAIIGTGLIGGKRAEAIARLAQVRLQSVYDIDRQLSETFAKKYHTRAASDLDSVLSDPTVDLVIVAIQHKAAAAIAPKILAKKHLLIEKPIGRNLIETKAIVAAAKKSGNLLFGGFNYRFYPHVALMAAYIKSQKLGTIISSKFIIGHAAQPGYEKTWKMDKELCGGGVLIDPGIHMIDLMLHWFGLPKGQYCFTNNLGWHGMVEDEASVVFVYHNGAHSVHHYSLNLAKNTFFIEVVGEKGLARINGRGGNYAPMEFQFTPKWFWQDERRKIVTKNFGDNDMSFKDELAAVVQQVRKIPGVDIDYSHYLASMSLIASLSAKG